MPVTGWVKAQTVGAAAGWTPSGAASLLLALASPVDSQLCIHADPATNKLRCTNYDFASEGLIATDVIDGIEFECYSTTGLAHITPGYTLGVFVTLDGTTPVGSEREMDCDGPGMQQDTLGASNDPWGNALTGADVLTATFGFLIAQGSTSSGSPTQGRQVDYERARIYYSNAVVSPIPIMASKHRRIPDLGAVRNKGLGEKTT